jgi:hypothetical protein
LKKPTKSYGKLNANDPAAAEDGKRLSSRTKEDPCEVLANYEIQEPNVPDLLDAKTNGANDWGTTSVESSGVFETTDIIKCDFQVEQSEGLQSEGECIPNEQETRFGDQLLNAAMIGLGVVAIAALVSSTDVDEIDKRNLTQDTKLSRKKNQAKQPKVSQWLYELDKVKENTAVDRHSLSSETWDGVRKETDAIVLLGHLVKRDTALKATGYLGSEQLLLLALKKKAFQIAKTGFWGGCKYSPVENFDQNDAQNLASEIENELFSQPIWEQCVGGVNRQRLKDGVQKIIDLNVQKSLGATARYNEARFSVNWKSRARTKPGESYFNLVKDGFLRDIKNADDAQKSGAIALADLELGKIVSARKFLSKYLA